MGDFVNDEIPLLVMLFYLLHDVWPILLDSSRLKMFRALTYV